MVEVTGWISDVQENISIAIISELPAEIIDISYPGEVLPNISFQITCVVKNPNNVEYMMYAQILDNDGNRIAGTDLQHAVIQAGSTHQFTFVIPAQTGTSFDCVLDVGRITDVNED